MKAILNKIVIFVLTIVLLGAVTVSASFVPSIEQKGSPEVNSAIDANGNDVTSWIVVTSYSKRSTLDSGKQSVFEESYRNADRNRFFDLLKSAYSLSARTTGPVVTLLSNTNMTNLPVHDASELVVSDLFNVHEFEDRGMIALPVTLEMSTNLPAHTFTAVFEYVGGQWNNAPAVVHGDGTMTLTVNQWGPYAIVTNLKQESNLVPSPQTGVESALPLVCVGIVGAAALLLVLRKRNAA